MLNKKYLIWFVKTVLLWGLLSLAPVFGQNINDCDFGTGWDIITIVDGTSDSGYSNNTTVFPKTCSDIAQPISCQWGNLKGNYATYQYASCTDWAPKDCILPWWSSLVHSGVVQAVSQTGAEYPRTCDDYTTELSCNNGVIVGNTNAFPYPKSDCKDSWGLVDGIDLRLDIQIPGADNSGSLMIAQYSSPTFTVSIKNRGKDIFSKPNINAGFLKCTWESKSGTEIIPLVIYQSKVIKELTINPGTEMSVPITIKDIFTQTLWEKNVTCTLWQAPNRDPSFVPEDKNMLNNERSTRIEVVEAGRFDLAMSRSIQTIKSHLDAPETITWGQWVNEFLFNKVMNILVPFIIVVGILISMIGFYKIMFSSDDKGVGDWVKYIAFGLVWIIVMMSAKFISNVLYSDIFNAWVLGFGSVQGYEIAQKLYENLLFPFLKIAIFLALGVLFVILVSRVITFIFGTDDDAKKKAGTIIWRNSIGMLVIIWAKQIVEAVYGKQTEVVKAISNLGEVWWAILANRNIPLFYQIINRALWLASLIILIMIILQAFGLLTNPDNAEQSKKLKNSLLYIFIGMLIIAIGYIITNFLVIN